MNRHWRRVVSLIVLVVPFAFSQSPADAPASREDVLKLFDVMNVRDQMRNVMDSVAKQQRAMIHEALKKRSPQITDEDLARMDKFTSDIMKDMPIDGMIDDMIPVYQKHLTHGDVDAMGTFYASPTGQKLLREMPAMTAESMQAAGPRIQTMVDKVMDQAEKMTQEDREKQRGQAKPATGKN